MMSMNLMMMMMMMLIMMMMMTIMMMTMMLTMTMMAMMRQGGGSGLLHLCHRLHPLPYILNITTGLADHHDDNYHDDHYNDGHGCGPALGQAGRLSRLDRWRS